MSAGPAAAGVAAVIKVGGGLLRRTGALEQVTAAVASAGRRHRVVVVPGGGPFADAVREIDRRIGLPPDAAHWMAILAMDQFAHVLAARIGGAGIVEEPERIAPLLARGGLPVLAPARWLRAADPLPHSWDVTSDSIAAWVAAALGARRLILIKPVAGDPARLVDPHFARVAASVEHQVLAAPDIAELERLLDGGLGSRPSYEGR